MGTDHCRGGMIARLPFAARFKSATLTLIFARASFDIWWLYIGAETRRHFLPTMNRFSEFFRYDQEAHWRAAIVATWSLFDKRSDTITLAELLRESAKGGRDVSKLQQMLDALR